MFDKLVESTSTGADVKPRRRIFAATLILVTTAFATALVASIYAADFDLGASNFDIAELLTPVIETEPPREPEPQPQPRNSNLPQSTNNEIVRQVLMAPTAESTKVPEGISTVVNPYASTSADKYRDVRIGRFDSDPGSQGNTPVGSDRGSNYQAASDSTDDTESKAPPPAVTRPVKPLTPSLGVINGKATSLPHPPYPAMAKAANASGAVNVQVTIDEDGNVISARAVSGHPMLRKVSEDAARRAKFTTTYLSKVPVKVTGVIVYNFTR